MRATVAASSCVASAITEERVIQLDPVLVWRLTTMLPIGAPPPPEFLTVRAPVSTSWPATVAPGVAVTCQVTVDVAGVTEPVFASDHDVVLVCASAAFELTSEIPARAPAAWVEYDSSPLSTQLVRSSASAGATNDLGVPSRIAADY